MVVQEDPELTSWHGHTKAITRYTQADSLHKRPKGWQGSSSTERTKKQGGKAPLGWSRGERCSRASYPHPWRVAHKWEGYDKHGAPSSLSSDPTSARSGRCEHPPERLVLGTGGLAFLSPRALKQLDRQMLSGYHPQGSAETTDPPLCNLSAATPSKLEETAVSTNTQKQTQRVRQNEEKKDYIPNKRVRQNLRKRRS